MHLYARAYLYQGGAVVLDKSMIVNAKDEEFTEITFIISRDQIKRYYEDLDLLGELEDEDGEEE